jgi:hypothetical protein
MIEEVRQMKTPKCLVIGAAVVAASLAFARQDSSARPVSGASSTVITAPGANGVTLPEIDEFATTVMHDPWDMNALSDLAYYREVDSDIANSQFSNGIYSGQMTAGTGGERITLLTIGSNNNVALRIGKIGYNYPINADYYRYLTFRMYSSNTHCNSGLMEWRSDDSGTAATSGLSNVVLVPPLPCTNQPAGWYTYVIDLKTLGIQWGSQTWTGTMQELIIHPFAGTGAAGATVKLDYARLTAVDPRTVRAYTIQWREASGNQVTLYASPTGPAFDSDQTIVIGTVANTGSYQYFTGVLPAGSYFIGVKDDTGTTWSAGPLVINPPPQISIDKPSMTSGQDFATTELGNPWDMSDAGDLNTNLNSWEITSVGLVNENFSNGIYSAQVPTCPSGNADPVEYLGGYPQGRPMPTIDTGKYRYLTYRFYHSGTQDVGHGWMARFGWWTMDGYNAMAIVPPALTRDLIFQEGWNTYKIDLWRPDLVDPYYLAITPNWQASHPNRLRFDPDELDCSLTPATIQLDYLLLTAMDTVKEGDPFPIRYTLTGTFPMTLSFYYTTDPANTGVLIGTTVKTSADASGLDAGTSNQIAASSPLTLTHHIYLPIVMRNFLSCSGNCFLWNTTGVAATYYVCIKAQDAYNAAYRCSEAPVVVSEAEN